MDNESTQSIKEHIIRTGYEKYLIKFKNTPSRSGVVITPTGGSLMKLTKIRIAKIKDKNNEIELELYSDINQKK